MLYMFYQLYFSNFWFWISRIKNPRNVKTKERWDKGNIILWMRFQPIFRSYIKKPKGSTTGITCGQTDTTSGQASTMNGQRNRQTSTASGQNSSYEWTNNYCEWANEC